MYNCINKYILHILLFINMDSDNCTVSWDPTTEKKWDNNILMVGPTNIIIIIWEGTNIVIIAPKLICLGL